MPQRHSKSPRPNKGEPARRDDGLSDDWMEWGGELLFVVGFTSGGAPYGVRLQDFPPEDVPEELKEVAAQRRAEEARLSAFHTEPRARREDDVDARDVPF